MTFSYGIDKHIPPSDINDIKMSSQHCRRNITIIIYIVILPVRICDFEKWNLFVDLNNDTILSKLTRHIVFLFLKSTINKNVFHQSSVSGLFFSHACTFEFLLTLWKISQSFGYWDRGGVTSTPEGNQSNQWKKTTSANVIWEKKHYIW